MGNSSRRPQDYSIVKNYRKQDWIQYLRSAQKQLWKHRQTHESAEVHRLYEVPSIVDLNRYEWRSTQQDIVKVFHITYDPNGTICGKLDYVQLLVEHIPIKLTNVNNLDLEEALTLLVAACRAFHEIQQNLEPVEPNEELIGFNEIGRPKIWLNKKSNINFPEKSYSLPFSNTCQQVSARVRKIFDLVEQKSRNSTLPPFLKDQFRQRSPNYIEAIAIVQQFAYRQHLSLQRYIRSDLLLSRKTSVAQLQHGPLPEKGHNRNHSSITNLHFSGCKPQQLTNQGSPQLKRMFSVDNIQMPVRQISLHNISPHKIQPITLRDNIHFRNPSFLNNTSNPDSYKSVPKINFVNSNKEPLRTFVERPGSPSSYQSVSISQNSIMVNSHHKSNNAPHQQVVPKIINKQLAIFQNSQVTIQPQPSPSVPQKIDSSSTSNKIQPISLGPYTTPVNSIEQEVEYYREEQPLQKAISLISKLYEQNHEENELEVPQMDVKKKSIIDEVQAQVLRDHQEVQSPNQQFNRQIFDSINYDNEVLASGTFKPINQHEMVHSQHDSEEGYEYEYKENPISIQNNHPSNPQMPLSFDSFAPNFMPGSQFVSFAPENNINTEKSIEDNEARTCKSVQYQQQQQMNHNDTFPALAESGEEKVVSSHEYTHFNQIYNAEVYQSYQGDPQPTYSNNNFNQEQRRISIDKYETKEVLNIPENPFYVSYTPVQSKFDIVIKKDSFMSKDNEREERVSAFADLKDDDDIEKYVRQKYDSYLHSKAESFALDQVKFGRVQSQYQTYKVKEYEHYDYQNLEKTKEKINHKPIVKPVVAVKTPRNNISNITEKTEEDFLDVNFLEKSLDKKYSSIKKTGEQNKRAEQEDQLNIGKLQQGLLKFSNSKLSQMNTQNIRQYQPKESKKVQREQYKYTSSYADSKDTTDYYSKYNGSPSYDSYKYKDYKNVKENRETKNEPESILSHKKKKSVRIEPSLNVQFSYQLSAADYSKLGNNKLSSSKQYSFASYRKEDFTSKYASKDYQTSIYRSKDSKKERSSKISDDLTNKIDERFNKYVKGSNYSNAYSKPTVQIQKAKRIQSPRFKQDYISPALEKGQSIQQIKRDRDVYNGGKSIRDAGLGERRISYDQLRGLLWN